MSTCDWLGLETLGYQLILAKNLPGHWPLPDTIYDMS